MTQSALPQGTVTFAFTDIEGSTSLLKRLGDDYAQVLREHRHIMRDTFGAHSGIEIDTQGDAFFYVFARAGDAVAAAADAQRAHADHEWPDGVQVRVRMGLHTGEPTLGDDGYVGLDVVRAARLCGECRGGQVLLSQVTRALAGARLPDGVDVFRLGARHLKDIDEPEIVYELEISGVNVAPAPTPAPSPPSTSSTPSPPSTRAPQPGEEASRRAAEPGAESRFEARVNAWAAKAEEQIMQQVLASLEGTESPIEDADLDAMADRNKNLSSRIIGGLIEIWRNPPDAKT